MRGFKRLKREKNTTDGGRIRRITREKKKESEIKRRKTNKHGFLLKGTNVYITCVCIYTVFVSAANNNLFNIGKYLNNFLCTHKKQFINVSACFSIKETPTCLHGRGPTGFDGAPVTRFNHSNNIDDDWSKVSPRAWTSATDDGRR